MTLLTQERIEVRADNDVVEVLIGRTPIRFAYGTAFGIAQALRIAGNAAGQYAGIPIAERQSLKRPRSERNPAGIVSAPPVETSPEPRWTGERTPAKWAVDVDGELVHWRFGNLMFTFEAATALTLANWIRIRGKEAKAWAGDRGRTLRIAGLLTDAEQAYKRGTR